MLGELTPQEIEDLLRSEITGRIGCHAEGRTYVVPITYAYKDGYVYCHGAEGQKIRMMRKNPDVCFEVDRVEDIGNWKSVVTNGRFQELGGRAALEAMDVLIARFAAIERAQDLHPLYVLRASEADSPRADGRPIVLFRLRLIEKTGRFERTNPGS
ncbi:MAG: pyridoxamine 5'-phosphate oxidase family protein [Acidobacteriota bacterium]|nr:pyridoxamine 5'-phosphate oxidase family protein [Acidobacteriota bacterium]MDQ5871191.1 pyridoxamine 5'-phosphate oxidase family protein [Acidobacteriota bacterium]